jgi:glucose/arabinose dehydrogenase
MKYVLPLALALLIPAVLHASTLPGFRAQRLGSVPAGEFLSSVAADSHGTVYFTTTTGNLYRFAAQGSTRVAHVDTVAIGDAGLLGMALRDDRTAIVHYTTAGQTYDVISSIDLTTGEETVLLSLVADKDFPARGSSAEHHGGNPSVAKDGSIFVGIGDYGGGWVASQPDWNGGKVWRILPDGSAHWYVRGLRNPFDVVFDDASDRLIVPDNGAAVDDEINVVHDGDFCGWPFTSGNGPLVDGAITPVYVFPTVAVPTGIAALNGTEPLLRHGYLLGSFVTKAIYYIPDIDARPLQPIVLMAGDAGPIIDVTEAATGEIYFGTGAGIWRLFVPQRGDCNGDGLVDGRDLTMLAAELVDGGGSERMTDAPAGAVAGSWGCDVDGDGLIDARDLRALESMVSGRPRTARH